nr:hypothetical protein [Tanacetum cinerariifolium]
MEFFAYIHVPNPTKVRVVEREWAEVEPRVLEMTFGRTVLLLPIASDRADSDLEASVNRLFDEGGSGAGGERLRKKKKAATDAGGSSHPPKNIRSDYIALSVAPSAGKSLSGLRDLLARSMLNVESGAEVATTLPFVTSFVSATLEHDGGVPTAPERFVISLDSSLYSANAFEAEGSSTIRTVRPDIAGSSHVPEKELSLGSRDVNSKSLHQVFIPRWSIPNDYLLDSLDASWEFIDNLAPQVLSAQIQDMDYEALFIEFSAGTARQICLSVKLRMRTEFCLSERRRLESQLGKQADLLKSKDEEIKDLKARILLKDAKAAEAIHLRVKASNFEAAKKSLQDELKVVIDKLKKLYANFVDMALHLKEKFYPHLLTTISGHRWLLTHGIKLAVTKCLDSFEYLYVLGAAIGKAIKKGMQDGLAARIIHGAEGRTMADVAAYNPSVEADYVSALQRLQNINFSLLVELRSSKDASIDIIMNILRLEDNLAERENIASKRPALRDVFILISEPFSAEVLTVTRGTSDTLHAPITTALSTALAFANTVARVTVDDYGVVGIDDRSSADADPSLNVDDVELNMP